MVWVLFPVFQSLVLHNLVIGLASLQHKKHYPNKGHTDLSNQVYDKSVSVIISHHCILCLVDIRLAIIE